MVKTYSEDFESYADGTDAPNPPWTNNTFSSAKIKTTQPHFGTKSLELIAGGAAQSINLTKAILLSPDYIEFWIRTPATNVDVTLMARKGGTATTIFGFRVNPGSGNYEMYGLHGGTIYIYGGTTITNLTWYRVKMVLRTSAVFDVCLDGRLHLSSLNNNLISADADQFRFYLTTPETIYVDDIIIEHFAAITATSTIGDMALGTLTLGTGRGIVSLYDSVNISDTDPVMDMDAADQETITTTDVLVVNMTAEELEASIIHLLEDYGTFPALGYTGILGKIVLRMDVDSTDFCQLVAESGQSIEINGTPGRAFLQVQQSKRSYDHGVAVYPGDAVLYSCPEDEIVLKVGDEIYHDGYTYKIIAIQHAFFNGNIIYRESALMRIRATIPIGQVTGLVASDNYEGKTTLTWDAIDTENLSHYEIWESLNPITTEAIAGITNDLDTSRAKVGAYVAANYIPNQLVVLNGTVKDDGDYALQTYQDDGYGIGELVFPWLFKDTTTAGIAYNMKNYWLREKRKSTGATLKNLIPNTKYYYMVRAIDVYGNAGKFSTEADTDIKTVGTRMVEGLR